MIRLPLTFVALLVVLQLATPSFAKPPAFARHVCPNGLEVIVAERHSAPLVTIELAAHNGAMAEPPEYSGLSHLYEHMFFKGNAAYPDEVATVTRLRELGGYTNGQTLDNRVNYFFTTTSDYLADMMVFMRDAAVTPLFEAKQLEQERTVVTGEMDRDESEPTFLLWREVTHRVYWKYPTRKDPLGARKTVLATTPAMMRTIQSRYYVPNNSVLIVAGDVKADDVFKQADELYAGWKKAADPFVKFPLVRHPPIKRAEVVVIAKPVQTFDGMVKWLGPSTLDASAASTYTADLLATAIGSPGSKFQKDLVDSGACVRAYMSYGSARDDGDLTVGFDATEPGAEACVKAVFAELPRLAAPDYFSDEELRNAAHTLDVSLAQERETNEGWAHQLSFWWAAANLAYYDGYVEHVSAVTQADIASYVQTYILKKPFVFGALESPALAKTLDQAHLAALAGKGGAK